MLRFILQGDSYRLQKILTRYLCQRCPLWTISYISHTAALPLPTVGHSLHPLSRPEYPSPLQYPQHLPVSTEQLENQVSWPNCISDSFKNLKTILSRIHPKEILTSVSFPLEDSVSKAPPTSTEFASLQDNGSTQVTIFKRNIPQNAYSQRECSSPAELHTPTTFSTKPVRSLDAPG